MTQQIGICLEKFTDAFGVHITTLGSNISADIKNGLNNPDNLRIDKRVGESKKPTNFFGTKISEEDDKPNNRRKRKKLSKTSSRDKSQTQRVQRMWVSASSEDDIISSATDTRDVDYVLLPSENEMDGNIEELHSALQWDDKDEDEQEPAKFKEGARENW